MPVAVLEAAPWRFLVCMQPLQIDYIQHGHASALDMDVLTGGARGT